ncbi:MAG TPA: TolC family protein [Salinimicrobium sp.]|nr:TolC family protein [Salinimicrobium sp.]
MYKSKKIFKDLLHFPLWGLGSLFFFLPLWWTGGSVSAQTLEDYLQIAAENNAGLKASYAEFEAALQEVPQVSSLPDPTLSMSAFGPMAKANFSLMQMFPWFGTLEAKADVAALMAEAKFQAYLNNRSDLFYRVSEKYFELYEVEESIQFQQDNFNILENYKELALAKVRAGSGALADVLQTELILNETQTALEILEMQRKPLAVQFNALLNRPKDADIEIPEELELEIYELTLGQDINFEDHPRLVAMEKMLAAARAQETVAKKEGLPTFGIGVGYAVVEKDPGMDMPGNGQDMVMPMLSISLPIFRKKYKAARKEAEFMQESYSQRKIELENTLSSEFASAVFTLEKSMAMLDLYEKQVESTRQVLNLLLSSYQSAAADFEEVLRVRQELLKYQLAVAGAEANYFSALARINYLTGKAF